jgi:hypothetical protein
MERLHPDKETFSLEEARHQQREIDVDVVAEKVAGEEESESEMLFESTSAAQEYDEIIGSN